MAFCKYCGKELNDGETCTCQNTLPATDSVAPDVTSATDSTEAPKIVIHVDTQQFSGFAKNVGMQYLKIWKQFSTGGKELFAATDKIYLICFSIIQAIISAILALYVTRKINSLTDGIIGSLLGSYSKALKISGAKSFFATIAFSLIFSAIWGGLFWLVGLISKAKMNLNQVLATAAIRAIICAPLTFISALLFLLSPFLGIGVGGLLFLFSIFLMISSMTEILKSLNGITENKCVYVTAITVWSFMILFFLLGTKMLSAYIPSGIGNIKNLIEMLS